MIIQMSNKEFKDLREMVVQLKDPVVTKKFNAIFSFDKNESRIKGFVNPLNNGIVIEVNEKDTRIVEQVLIKKLPEFAKIIKKGIGIGNINKLMNMATELCSDLSQLLK